MVDYFVIKKAIAFMFTRQADYDELGDEDIVISSHGGNGEPDIVIRDEEIRKAYNKAEKIKSNQVFLSTSHYAEVAVRSDGRFARPEKVEVPDSVNGIVYRLGPASPEYCIHIINLIFESEESDFRRAFYGFRIYFNMVTRRGTYEQMDFEGLLSRTLNLTSLKMQFENETSSTQIRKYASAFEYLFMYKRGYALFEISDISTLLRIEGGGRSRVSVLEEAPKRSVNQEILEFYSMALAAEDPFTRYISFYHIVEYYFDEVYQKKLIDDMKEKITSPDFSYKNDKMLLDLASFISKRMKSDNEAGKGNEQESLVFVLTTFVPIEELKEKLNEINPALVQFYAEKSISFTGNQQLKIAWNDLKGVYSSLARRIYVTRNALVHSKSGQSEKSYKPLKHKAQLQKELPLIQVVAELVITKSGEVL